MTKITPWPEQKAMAGEAIKVLKEHGLVYLAMEERTGKTLTAILIAEDTIANRILVISKKTALKGWNDMLDGYIHLSSYTVVNYHQAHKVKGDFDLVILDEPHNYVSGYPKTSAMWKNIHKLVYGLPIIYMSATPNAQGVQLLFNQFKLCKFSPWDHYEDFYEWFKKFAKRDGKGNLPVTYIGNNRTAIDYKKIEHDLAFSEVEHLFLTKTRAELGFEHEPEDELHFIDLDETTRGAYNALIKHNVLEFSHQATNRDYSIICDSGIKLRWTLHMLEGGVLKYIEIVNKKEKVHYLVLNNSEKIDYMLNVWGDTKDLVIMHQYKAEAIKLQAIFKKARILQATSYAEGVDLSMHKHLVIYSQDFSTARHTQRRARQANKNRDEEIKVHYLLVKKAVSEQVYNVCSKNKKNFVDSLFEREEL
jgi:hypothetical protein